MEQQSANNYTLGYWKIRGLGFKIRIILEYLGLDYKNVEYEQGDGPEFSREAWLNVKEKLGLTFPNLPYFVCDEGNLTETLAIIQYIVDKHNPDLGGRTPFEKAQVSMIGNILHSIYTSTTSIAYNGDRQQFKESVKQNVNLQRVVQYLNNSNYLIDNDFITWADLYLFDTLESFSYFTDNEIYKYYPQLKAFYDKISQLPQIQNWKKSERYFEKPFNNKHAKIK